MCRLSIRSNIVYDKVLTIIILYVEITKYLLMSKIFDVGKLPHYLSGGNFYDNIYLLCVYRLHLSTT